MAISLGNAISSIKEDEKWIPKILIGGAIGYIIPFVIGFIVGFVDALTGQQNSLMGNLIIYTTSIVIGIYITGFVFTTMNRVINSSDKFKMAEWNEKNLMLTGLKTTLILIGWGIIMALIFLVLALIFGIIGGIISFILASCLHIEGNNLSIFITIFSCACGAVVGLYIAQFLNNAFACFLKTLRFKELISFKKHFRMIKENQHANWSLVGKNILLTLAIVAVAIVLMISVVGFVVLPFVYFAVYFVMYNLICQYAKEIDINKYIEE